GETNYEQPMHTDRNHSWLPAKNQPPWWHLETFLYLSDVDEGSAPTHIVSRRDSGDRATTVPLVMPKRDPELYAAERPAPGVCAGRYSRTAPTCSTAASTSSRLSGRVSSWPSRSRSRVTTGSATRRISRSRRRSTG